MSTESDSLDSILHKIQSIIRLVFSSADAIAISMLAFPKRIHEIKEYETEFHDILVHHTEISHSLASGSEEMDASTEQISSFIMETEKEAEAIKSRMVQNAEEQQKTLQELEGISQNSVSIREGSEKIRSEIGNLEKTLGQIHKSIAQVNGIAEQINMLSLNASIEAARAGEYGQGFSVVATGISNLADQSRSIVKNINESVQSMNVQFESWSEVTSKHISSVQEILDRLQSMQSVLEGQKFTTESTVNAMRKFQEVFGEIGRGISDIKEASQQVSENAVTLSGSADTIAVRDSQIGENLNQMEKQVEEAVSLVTLQNPIWLLYFLLSRRLDHEKWMQQVDRAISASNPNLLPELDHTKCKMGMWYYQTNVTSGEHKKIHEQMEEPHRFLHSTAIRIQEGLNEKNSAKVQQARKELDGYYSSIGEIFNLYTDFLEKEAFSSLQNN